MATPLQLPLEHLAQRTETEDSANVPIDKSFPEETANALARLESFNKHLFRPNTYLHKWWARRAGTTFRHILKQLVEDPTKRDFYSPGGLEGKIILDPMMGGGTTLHEAIRMGASVVGVDIDPIPVLQARASLSCVSLDHKRAVFAQYLETLRGRISHLYLTRCPDCGAKSEIQFVIYGLRQKCRCREVIILDSFLLREDSRRGDLRICPKCCTVYDTKAHSCDEMSSVRLVERKEERCHECGVSFSDITETPYNERYIPLVVVGLCGSHGQFFKSPDRLDIENLSEARRLRGGLNLGEQKAFLVPLGPKSVDLRRRGINSYLELYTPRQLLYLFHSIDLIGAQNEIDRLWLSLLVSTSLDFNCLLAGYKGADKRRPGAIRHVFSHHAYSIPYTAVENNPVFSNSTSGTLERLFKDRIVNASEWAADPVEAKIHGKKIVRIRIAGEVDKGESAQTFEELQDEPRKFRLIQGDARNLDLPEDSVDHVVTDPPYYDSVQYGDLSRFFRVWLRLLLPSNILWDYDQSNAAVAQRETPTEGKYCETLAGIWNVCFRVIKKQRGRLIFTFHHWRPSAWAELTISLKRAGFVLVNRYVVFSENPISVHIRQLKALKHDVILVLKPRGKQLAPQWSKVHRVDATDSSRFCRDCGSALGWLLNSDYGEEQIAQKWHTLIGGP